MIKKIYKLKGEEIKEFFKNKKLKKLEGNKFTIFFLENDLNYPRFAVKPVNKVFKKAVERNRVKRRIYSIIEKWLKNGWEQKKDFFILVKSKEVLNKKYAELEEELINLIKNV